MICNCFGKLSSSLIEKKSFSIEFSKCTFSIYFVHKNLIPLGIRFLCTKYMEKCTFTEVNTEQF